MDKWYSRYWHRPMFKIGKKGEWKEYSCDIIDYTTTVYAKTEKYKPTMKQRMNLLRDEINHSVWLDAARHLFLFKQRHESKELDIACGVVAWLQLILLLITWIL